MAAKLSTCALCRVVVTLAMLVQVATPHGWRRKRSAELDPDLESSFIFDIGAGRRRLPVSTVATGNVRRLTAAAMYARLGHHFDPDWMSVDRPTTAVSGRASAVNRSRDDPELVRDLRRLRFTYRDERGAERRLEANVAQELERWLLQQAHCDVLYTWEDMGELFWPRWVRHGRCDTLAPCSWPPGMHCAPAPSETLRLLHWQCRRRQSTVERRRGPRSSVDEDGSSALVPRHGGQARRRRMRHGRQPVCRWKKVPYPVTMDCFCSC